MGVDVCTWRARIGVFRATVTAKCLSVNAEGSTSASENFEFGLIVAILLIIAGVEINPGPFTLSELQQIVDAMQPTITEANRQQTEVLQRELLDVKTMVNEYKQQCVSQHNDMKKELQQLRDSNRDLTEKVNMQESILRKNNIIIHGITETENENTEDVVYNVCSDLSVNIRDGMITEAVRMGRNKGKRPILCKFNTFAKKKEIMDKNRSRGSNQFSIYHDLSKNDRDHKKLLKPYRDYAVQHNYKAYIRGSKLIINGETWTLEELEEHFGDQMRTAPDDRADVISNAAVEQRSVSRKDINKSKESNALQTPGTSGSTVVTRNRAVNEGMDKGAWPLPGPTSTPDEEQMETSTERMAKRNYSKVLQSPPTLRKKSTDLAKDISKKFDSIAGKMIDKSPSKRGKLMTTE
jgi:uncharacterized membrane-anchored protein YhcB (DUF1043 family)